jgi:HK97 family phage major capsid protein
MADITDGLPADEMLRLDLPAEAVSKLSRTKRILGLRIAPYGVVADSRYGPLMFERGAFGDVDPREVRLRMDHADPPTGTGRSFVDKPDAAYMDFAVSRTQRGDEQLELAADGTSTGASIGFHEVGKVRVEQIDGRRVLVFPPDTVRLDEVSTTWQPTFKDAGVIYVMSKQGDTTVAETEAPVIKDVKDEADRALPALVDRILSASDDRNREMAGKMEAVLSQLGSWQERFEELARSQFTMPAGESRPRPKLHHWVEVTLRNMAGQRISPHELKTLALDDVITTEQPGLVPSVFTADYDDLINADRPFLSSTRNVVPPRTGNSMTLPIITTRAVAGTQAGGAEKGALTTTATKVGTGTFNYASVFGGADISVQMLNRAEASFFDLLTGDIAMAYALDCEVKAIDALLAGYTDSASAAHAPATGGALDPEAFSPGAAWETSIAVYKRAPDTIWMSAAAVSAFIDAKEDGTNRPLYSDLAAAFTAGGGPGGSLSGLRPVYVPALDPEDVDVIIGPSRGFVWAEDPARTLQADNPAQAGRDIVLAGGIFPAPRFADAFTVYTLSS